MQDFRKPLVISGAGEATFGRLRLSKPIIALPIQNFVLGCHIILVKNLAIDSFEVPF